MISLENKRSNSLKDLQLPEAIKHLVSEKKFSTDDIGMSKAKILLFDDCVLKIDKISKNNDETVEMMHWLEGKLPVPKVLCYEKDSEHQFLLMSKVQGKMACDKEILEHPQELIHELAEALKMLWSVDVSNCPRKRDIDVKLKEAQYRVENNLVDVNSVDPATFEPNGFKDPYHLLNWLENNKPTYEPVLSHGDFTLPNIFIDNGKFTGLIDLDDVGIGDKWGDIALCYRSLKWNSEGVYGDKISPNLDPEMLFDTLGIEPNWEKIRYFILLDELF